MQGNDYPSKMALKDISEIETYNLGVKKVKKTSLQKLFS